MGEEGPNKASSLSILSFLSRGHSPHRLPCLSELCQMATSRYLTGWEMCLTFGTPLPWRKSESMKKEGETDLGLKTKSFCHCERINEYVKFHENTLEFRKEKK